MPESPRRSPNLDGILEPFGGPGQHWCPDGNVAGLLASIAANAHARLQAAQDTGRQMHATVINKPRGDGGPGRALTLRTDGIAGCLMGKADLRYQQVCRVHGAGTGIRPLTRGELGRLMGLPPDYLLPFSVAATAKLTGNGVAFPLVRWLAARLLQPLTTGAAAPHADTTFRVRPRRARKALDGQDVPGLLKQRTVGTTVYFLPSSRRGCMGWRLTWGSACTSC